MQTNIKRNRQKTKRAEKKNKSIKDICRHDSQNK